MIVTRMESFRTRFRRIRQNVGGATQESGGDEPGRNAHVVSAGLTILDVMEGDLVTVPPESPMRPAIALMIEHRISSVPVVDESGRIVGALNEGDLMKVFYDPDTQCVADVMTRSPIVLPIDAPLVDVIDELMSSDFRRVLIHENERLVGVITRSHVMPALLDALERHERDRG